MDMFFNPSVCLSVCTCLVLGGGSDWLLGYIRIKGYRGGGGLMHVACATWVIYCFACVRQNYGETGAWSYPGKLKKESGYLFVFFSFFPPLFFLLTVFPLTVKEMSEMGILKLMKTKCCQGWELSSMYRGGKSGYLAMFWNNYSKEWDANTV